MRSTALWLATVAVLSAEVRFARLGETDGKVEVEISPGEPWRAGERNLPLPEAARIRTGAQSHAEIELDDGSVLRLAPESTAAFSDYLRLSTRQRITLISLEKGVAYLTGEAPAEDALTVAAPGLQAHIGRGARLRIEAAGDASQISAMEGDLQVSAPAAELQLFEGQTARVEAARPGRFQLQREIVSYDSDRWSEERDKTLSQSRSATYLSGLGYGVVDLDSSGVWINTAAWGPVWQPRVSEVWVPFRHGKWIWYRQLGYTWVSRESWGWLPYHYGRWARHDALGWIWVPGLGRSFRAGDAYWLRGTNVAGWGPLAYGEDWTGSGQPRLYLAARTTFARFRAGAQEVDPEGFTARPADPLAVAVFATALPALPIPPAQVDRSSASWNASIRLLPPSNDVSTEVAGAGQPQESVDAAQPEPGQMPAPESPAQPVYVTIPVQVPGQNVVTFVEAPVPVETPSSRPPRQHRPTDQADVKPHAPPAPPKPPQPPVPPQPAAARHNLDDRPREAPKPVPPSEAKPAEQDRPVPRNTPRETQGGRRIE